MQDDTNPNPAMPQAPAEGAGPVNPMPQVPVENSNPVVSPPITNEGVVTPPIDASAQVPQGQDRSDAMTYPLGSQDAQPEVAPVTSVAEDDHRTILDRIMGIFSKGKKAQINNSQPTSVDQPPANNIPLGQ